MLRQWRRRRRLSQLELSLDCEVSARHLSFMETGRSKPSRDMVVRLAETLEVPLRERNHLLLAAGYAPAYSEQPVESVEMEPVRAALDRFLRAHEPYPAIVIDRHHNITAANDALGSLVEGVAPRLLESPANAIRVALHPEGMAPRTVNFAESSGHLMARLRREAQVSCDPVLEALYEECARYPGVVTDPPSAGSGITGVVMPMRLRDGDRELAFISTLSTFGSAVDVTLSELAIEAFYPANAQTAMRLLSEVS
ncbi:MAG TPA: helix-turn-helix domain-containing protein [Solirubrobacteraceae bacterium]|nr:helix-turn-helix domain-containing protein [Solirubrobacteraceae bacterium]